MSPRAILPSVFSLLVVAALAVPAQEGPVLTLDPGYHHLGDDATPEWTEASAEPEGQRYEVAFESPALAREGTLGLRQRNVNDPWSIVLNGHTVATLKPGEELVERFYPVPAGTLVDGTNTLVIEGAVPTDDIVIGDLRLWRAPFREVFDLRRIRVRVLDAADRSPLPGRIAVTTTATDEPVTLYYGERALAAVREGLIYAADG